MAIPQPAVTRKRLTHKAARIYSVSFCTYLVLWPTAARKNFV